MSQKKGYEAGMVEVDDGMIFLPHSCDRWVIGREEQARALIADLERAIEEVGLWVVCPRCKGTQDVDDMGWCPDCDGGYVRRGEKKA